MACVTTTSRGTTSRCVTVRIVFAPIRYCSREVLQPTVWECPQKAIFSANRITRGPDPLEMNPMDEEFSDVPGLPQLE
jgi:hypothetical protein